MSHILLTSTEHKTASLAGEKMHVTSLSIGAHNSRHMQGGFLTYVNLWKLALSGHLSTDAQVRD